MLYGIPWPTVAVQLAIPFVNVRQRKSETPAITKRRRTLGIERATITADRRYCGKSMPGQTCTKQPTTNSAFATLTFSRVVWFLPVAFALHITEEWPHFTAWAQTYASDQFTQRDYTLIHVSVLVGNILLAAIFSMLTDRLLIQRFCHREYIL
jgi:hypothetical protein